MFVVGFMVTGNKFTFQLTTFYFLRYARLLEHTLNCLPYSCACSPCV